jgi:predicted nucleic acid-binding protein
MSAERRTFSDPLELFIYWDASFAVALYTATDPWHAECEDFQLRMETEGSLAVASDFTYDEMSFILIRRQLAGEGKKLGLHWTNAFKAQPELLQLAVPQLDAAMADLDAATIQLPIPLTVRTRVFQLVRDFNLLPTDAYHIAVALEAGVNTFVTLDEDFLRVDGIVVYTTP